MAKKQFLKLIADLIKRLFQLLSIVKNAELIHAATLWKELLMKHGIGELTITDREKLEKVLEYVTQREDKFYKPIEDGKYEPGSLGAMQCMFQAASFQEARYFIENLLEV